MKRKLLTETPVCPQRHLVIISTQPACPLLKKGLGHLLQLLLLSYIYSHFIYSYCQLPLKTCLLVFTVNSWSKALINTFCSSLGSTLLFIESTTTHPLYLWVISAPTPWGHHLFRVLSAPGYHMGMILIIQLGLRSGFLLPHRASSVTEWGFTLLFGPQYSDRISKFMLEKNNCCKRIALS
jgi:hypothetical protein